MNLRIWPFIAVTVACSATSFTQSPVTAITNITSTPIPNVGHNYLGNLSEIVNPANGALSLRIAAPATKDRGTNWPLYVVTYDTNGQFSLTPTFEDDDRVWNMNKVSYGTNTVCAGSCPPSQAAYSFAGVTHATNNLDSGIVGGPGSSQEFTCKQSTGYIYTDPQGGRHNLGLQLAGSTGNYTNNCSYFGVTNIYSGGDEQYKAYIDPTFLTVHIVDEHGDYPLQEDHNGNLVFNSGKAPTASTSSTNPNSYTVTAHYPGTSGTYVETFGTQVLNFTLNLTGIGNCLTTTVTPASSNGFAISQLDSLVTPNGQKYTFTYDSTYGTLKQITYPTGAYTTYDWAPNSLAEGQYFNSGPHSDGTAGGCGARYDWPAIQHRTVSYDGKTIALKQDFQYVTVWPNSATTGNWTTKQTTVTTTDYVTGKSYVTVYNYTPTSAVEPNPQPGDGQAYIPQERTILYYDDANKQNLLKTATKTWLSALQLGAQCDTLAGGSTSGVFYTYQPASWASGLAPGGNGAALLTDLRTEVAEYDYGTVDSACDRPSASPLRDTKTTFWSQPTPYTPLFPASPSILDRPQIVTVAGSSGIQEETDYAYDQTPVVSLASNPPAGHDTKYAASNSTSYPRGNITTITKKCFQQCSNQVATFQYDETGQVRQTTPGFGAATTYSYTDAYTPDDGTAYGTTYIFPTKITRGPFSKTYTWGFNGGTLRSVTDENSQTSKFWYTTGGAAASTSDPWYRLTEADTPDGGKTTATYNDQGPKPSTVVSEVLNSTTTRTSTTVLDAAGHQVQTQRSDPVSTVFVDTTYDGLGRVHSVSNPYRSTSEATYGVTTGSYDALGRPSTKTEADGTSVQAWTYIGNAVTSQDESGRQWKRTTDALGRLSSVLEPGASTTTPSVQTAYTYDALSNLIRSVQTGVSGETARTRSFSYNSLSQLVTSNNPETGTICYGTWVTGSCQSGYDLDGNLVAKTDARSITATYGYDTLDRLTSKTYSDATPAVQLSYDQSQAWSSDTLRNTKGRLSSYTSGTGTTTYYSRLYSYDPMGRVSAMIDASPSEEGRTDQHTNFTYDQAGNVTDIWYPREYPTVGPHIQQTWQVDGLLHKVYSTDSGTEKDFLQAATYYADSTPSSLSLGNGVVENVGKNIRLQTQSLVASNLFSTASNPLAPAVSGYAVMSNNYAYTPSGSNGCGTSGNNGNIWQISDGLNTSWTRQFAYDCLNRLSAEKVGSALTNFTIDSFGNMSPLNGSSPVYTFNSATNRISNLPCSGSLTPFDAAGNQICDTDTNGANRSYAIDAEERPTSLTVQGSNTPFVQYVYSGEGDRVRKSVPGGTYREYAWHAGEVLTEKQTSTLDWTDYIYADGKKIARVNTLKYLLHLHGVRMSANSSCGVEGPASGTGIPANLPIVAGDHLAFDFLQTATSYGGMLLVFTDGTDSGAVQDMQTGTSLYNDGAKVGVWQHLEGDLTQYASSHKLISYVKLGLHQSMPAGTFDMYYANAVIVHANGTVTSINTVENVTVPVFSGSTCGGQFLSSATEQTSVTDPAITTTYYLSDHLGTTDLELSSGGWPTWHGHYNAYGQELGNASTWNAYKFVGKERDSESGLDYFGARYYASSAGRWTSPDWAGKPSAVPYSSLGNPQSLNLYDYVGNNPLSRADADGHCELVCATLVGVTIVGIGTSAQALYQNAKIEHADELRIAIDDEIRTNPNATDEMKVNAIADIHAAQLDAAEHVFSLTSAAVGVASGIKGAAETAVAGLSSSAASGVTNVPRAVTTAVALTLKTTQDFLSMLNRSGKQAPGDTNATHERVTSRVIPVVDPNEQKRDRNNVGPPCSGEECKY